MIGADDGAKGPRRERGGWKAYMRMRIKIRCREGRIVERTGVVKEIRTEVECPIFY